MTATYWQRNRNAGLGKIPDHHRRNDCHHQRNQINKVGVGKDAKGNNGNGQQIFREIEQRVDHRVAQNCLDRQFVAGNDGGFEGTGVKFLFCFPEAEKYTGRFYQYLSPFPGPDEEVASYGRLGVNDRIGFCLANGAYSVESNMGSTAAFGGQSDPTLCWKSSAAVAEYSRQKAMEIYGCSRPYGYVYGGSGGGYKTMSCVENTKAWDGGVVIVIIREDLITEDVLEGTPTTTI